MEQLAKFKGGSHQGEDERSNNLSLLKLSLIYLPFFALFEAGHQEGFFPALLRWAGSFSVII
jgi:hypothetical protein